MKFTPIQNHLDEDATFDGTMYETYGAELDFVFSVSQLKIQIKQFGLY
jgi:hypothetical protein